MCVCANVHERESCIYYTIPSKNHPFIIPHVSETVFKNVGENPTPIIFHKCCQGKGLFLSPSPLIFSSLALPHTVLYLHPGQYGHWLRIGMRCNLHIQRAAVWRRSLCTWLESTQGVLVLNCREISLRPCNIFCCGNFVAYIIFTFGDAMMFPMAAAETFRIFFPAELEKVCVCECVPDSFWKVMVRK